MFFEIANAAQGPLLEDTMEFWDFVLLVISLFVLVAGLLSVVFMLWWALLLILSWGKDDKIKPAINTIRYSVIWLVVTVLTIFVFPIIGRLLGLNVDPYFEPKKIFEKIWDISDSIFGESWTSSTSTKTLDDLPDDFSDL